MRLFSRQTKISEDAYNKAKREHDLAKKLLFSKEFVFVQEYIKNSLQSIEDAILNNTIRDVEEEASFGQSVVRRFFTPKKQQIDELCGQYRWIKQFFAFLEEKVSSFEELDKRVSEGSVVIEGIEGQQKDEVYA